MIAAGSVKAQTVEAVDQTSDDDFARMSIVGAEALKAGIYTAFVIPVNADGEAQNAKIQAVSFYMNEVAAGATEFDFTQLANPGPAPKAQCRFGCRQTYSWCCGFSDFGRQRPEYYK